MAPWIRLPPLTLLRLQGNANRPAPGPDRGDGAPLTSNKARLGRASAWMQPSQAYNAAVRRCAQVPSSAYGSVPNGYGVYTWPDGSRYEGDWLNGVKNGRGKYYWPRCACPQPSADAIC